MHTRPIWATYLWTFNCFNFVAYFYFLTMFCPFLGNNSRYFVPLACNHEMLLQRPLSWFFLGRGSLVPLVTMGRLFLRNFCVTDRVMWLFLQPLSLLGIASLTSSVSNISQ
ncbi:MAG: hypothetical protein BYD32DRAFT_228873 [Podila humilis]|nr:MAG: hypothetical protein BYD32DRAFT_228873 [Podila humilis]